MKAYPNLQADIKDRAIDLVGAMGQYYGTLIGFHPELAAELVRRYQLQQGTDVLFTGIDDDEESAAARRQLERDGAFEVIVRRAGYHADLQRQNARLIAALNQIAILNDGRNATGQYEIGYEDGLKQAGAIAREALRGTEGNE